MIENVVTAKSFQRMGYGRALLRHALSEAWKFGCYKVMLMTSRKDEGIRIFYESAGFRANEKVAFIARSESGA